MALGRGFRPLCPKTKKKKEEKKFELGKEERKKAAQANKEGYNSTLQF
jgi:hypothetical protein